VELKVTDRIATFEAHRPSLLALAYRMLGDLGRAEDVVQEAWLRWEGHAADVEALVVLQRLTPAERAVLLLRDVFEYD
jgi:DNA-directed RNA polymerase specialized sigma24 family protein